MMALRQSLSALFVVSLAFATCAPSSRAQTCDLIGPAVIKGKKFFDSRSGKYIPLKGVNYYPRPNAGELSTGNNRDFFSEEYRDVWERDLEEFKELGINVVRLYAVNPGLDHSGFMCALKSAGIYAIIGLAAICQDCAITGQAAPDCYPGGLKERGQFVINVFSKYENVLAFSAGNEAHLFAPGQPPEYNAACQKQFIRDMRAYIDSCPNLRKIPIGLAVADFSRDEKAMYYNCRSDPNDEYENAEWYGLNIYLHCDPSSQTIDDLEGFKGLLESHQSYSMSIPVILSEYGCENQNFPAIDGFEGQRDFLQVDALYSSEYEDYFAGGIVFEYSVEKTEVDKETSNLFPYQSHAPWNYGLGYFLPSDCDDIDTPCLYTPYPEFDILASRFAAAGTSVTSDLDSFSPADFGVTECPSNFPPLSSFTWESASVDDLDCVGPNYVFICPNTAPECLPPFAVSTPVSPPPTTAAPTTGGPTSAAPSVGVNDSPAPTLSPNDETETPTEASNDTPIPTTAPILDTEESPTMAPTNETPAPAISAGSTPAPSPTLVVQPVEFQPTNLIVAETSSVREVYALMWLWSSVCLLVLPSLVFYV